MRNVREFDDRQKIASIIISVTFLIVGCVGGITFINILLTRVSLTAHIVAGIVLYPLAFLVCGFVCYVISGFLCMFIDSFFGE
jgi:hypothetical protein